MSVSSTSARTGVVQSLSTNPGATDGTISKSDYDNFLTMGGGAAPANVKADRIAAPSFLGTPRKASVVFSAAYPDNDYAVLITGADARTFTIESKTAAGFTINTNANTAMTGEVLWLTTPLGGA
jgi:hypothetical protein